MQRIEKELQQKELRQEMKLRLARMQHQPLQKPQIVIIGGGSGSGATGMGMMGGYSTSGRADHLHGAIGGIASGSGYVVGDPLMHYMVRGTTVPSPLTPNSTDELLPSVDEAQEVKKYRIETNDCFNFKLYFIAFATTLNARLGCHIPRTLLIG